MRFRARIFICESQRRLITRSVLVDAVLWAFGRWVEGVVAVGCHIRARSLRTLRQIKGFMFIAGGCHRSAVKRIGG